MEDVKANVIAVSSIIILIIIIVVVRVTLKLSEAFYLIAGAAIASILAVFACFCIRKRLNDRRKITETRLVSEGNELRLEYSFLRKVAGVPTKFRHKELEDATDNFKCLIGRGGSASVFKGILKDGTSVAVKRIEGSEERGEKEFRSEVAAIASVQHLNLVRLFGYCCTSSRPPRYLVYEYISNGSLAKWIFPRRENLAAAHPGGGGCLSWDLRCRVATDVAKALSYLHHDCRSRVLHLDVKPENILLDENYRAIVSDFGLSKLMGRDESRVWTTLRGTKGYLAPEWLLELGVSEKSDVYSYGMVILEMIGGRRNVTMIENGGSRKFQYFPKIASAKLREGKFMELLDQRLLDVGGVEEKEVRKMVCMALWCIQEKPRRRPSMGQVVEWLEGRAAVEDPPETQMLIVDLLAAEDGGGERRPAARAVARFASSGRLDSRLPLSSRSLTYSFSLMSGR